MNTRRRTKEGWSILEGDTHFSKWIEETGKIDHGQDHYGRWRKYIKEGDHVVDIGAALGDTTVPLAQLVGPNGCVYAVEPNPDQYGCLCDNLVNAGVEQWVLTHQCALGGHPGELRLALQPNVGSSFLTNAFPVADGYVSVSIIPLDSLGIKKCEFIKIDAEGFEPFIIAGAVSTITRCRPILQVELSVHSRRYGIDKMDVARRIIELGYNLVEPAGLPDEFFQMDAIFAPRPIDFSI